ncbi:uncharacterized protein LOC124133451 [Haliotis rufescens]|uniref:uncharacterized protein LOC124133451 n=1 Tax=Haliotis rufescens TaxID=6454 RepID=UPI00201F0712|nr:uncharacterized protein LOC124133451 [Haliotis rufescens]
MMACLVRFLTCLLFCIFKVVSTASVPSATEMKTSLQDTQEMAENLTQRMDAMSAMFSENVRLMNSAEIRLRHTMDVDGGLVDTQTKLERRGGAVYTRWGHDTCPGGSYLAYSGFTVGGHHSHAGAGSNILCTHPEPQFEKTFARNTSSYNFLYGAEYEQIWRSDLADQDPPCAVCRSATRTSAILVPGRHECMEGWNTEYWGFLVGPKHDDAGNSEYICLDSDPKSIEGGYASHDGRLLFNVEYQCGSLPCPPYKNTYFVPCALCTK